jgi:hypothetical protein
LEKNGFRSGTRNALAVECGTKTGSRGIAKPASNPNSKPKLEIQFRLGYIVIFALLIGRWIYIASGTIDLEKDEAYQWLWSKHLALSYYSKPPGIALIHFLGTSLWGDTAFGIRFFPPLFAAITERDGAALLCPRSQRARGVLAAAHRHRHAAARHRHDFDDD